MTQTLDTREDPLNLGGGWAPSAPLRTWSSCHRRRRGAPIYRRRHRYGPKAEYEPPRKQPKHQYGPGSWFQPPPRRPNWAVCSNWERWGGPWRPPPVGFWKPPSPMQVIRVYGLNPFCLCCCSCWRGPWNPGWARPPGRKKRWGRRGRRHPRRSSPKSPPPRVDLGTLLRPVNLCGWRAPGMRAPQNTTQFIMNQIYEDMRQEEELGRQQEAMRAQQAEARGQVSTGGGSGNNAPLSGSEDDAELQETPYNFVQNPSLLVFTPRPEENQSPTPQPVEEEEKNEDEECEEEMCHRKEEESEEEEEAEEAEEDEEEGEGEEAEEDEEVEEEAGYLEEGEEEEEEMEELEEEEEGLEEEEQKEEENLPLEMPLSILVGAEDERENYFNCTYLSPEQIIPQGPQETLLMVQDINC
ncbi:coiled-coil domain-containing glutamate-rich protein 1 [Nycticebus coucang]|uniref:coiled-coil domain-containing glutamate-rich protein 1 n=1 Tax=Nycticebus coucang TaxID=9470 RepID=UPI00234D9F42|nr:coiled-coil domain-containing glutamate-rich protein 1 [Nycticebus coucang]